MTSRGVAWRGVNGVGAVAEPGLCDVVGRGRLAVDGGALVPGVVDGLVGVGDQGGVDPRSAASRSVGTWPVGAAGMPATADGWDALDPVGDALGAVAEGAGFCSGRVVPLETWATEAMVADAGEQIHRFQVDDREEFAPHGHSGAGPLH